MQLLAALIAVCGQVVSAGVAFLVAFAVMGRAARAPACGSFQEVSTVLELHAAGQASTADLTLARERARRPC